MAYFIVIVESKRTFFLVHGLFKATPIHFHTRTFLVIVFLADVLLQEVRPKSLHLVAFVTQ